MKLTFIFFITLILVIGGFAEASSSLQQLKKDFIKLQKQSATLSPEIDGQRFIDPTHWTEAYEAETKPWNIYGEDTFKNWFKGAQWIAQNADGLPFDIELYDRLERMVMQDHYYRGYELRRIQGAVAIGKLPPAQGEKLIARINNGERIYFSGVDHSKLTATFRTEFIDEFKHNGDNFMPDGSRYLTAEEIENARKNPLLTVDNFNLKEIAPGKFTGTIYYPPIRSLKPLVESSFKRVNTSLASTPDLQKKVEAILEFRSEMMTIHRSMDGNGRVIRLLADLLFLRAGLPVPAYPIENDIFGNPRELVETTLRDMETYLKNRQYHQLNPKAPKVLFHWSTAESFQWMRDHAKSNQAPMQTVNDNSFLALEYPALGNRKGTFAWTNPLNATYGGRYENGRVEWYVKPNRTPVLVGYFIKADAQVKKVVTVEGVENRQRDSFTGIDLLYHQHVSKTGQLVYHEWIIVNPSSVKRWSADPSTLKPYIEKEQQRTQMLKDAYPELDRHFIDTKNDTRYTKAQSQRLIDKLLESTRSTPAAIISCQHVFL